MGIAVAWPSCYLCRLHRLDERSRRSYSDQISARESLNTAVHPHRNYFYATVLTVLHFCLFFHPKAYLEQCNTQMDEIMELIRGTLSVGARLTLKALLVIDVHGNMKFMFSGGFYPLVLCPSLTFSLFCSPSSRCCG